MVQAGDVQLCSNLLDTSDMQDLEALVDKFLPEKVKPLELPGAIGPALARAKVLAGSETPHVTVTVKGEALKIQGKFAFGTLNESLQLKGPHPDITAEIDAELVERALAHTDEFMLTPRALLLFGEDFLYLVATVKPSRPSADVKEGKSRK
jgi:hypothetical protein